MLTKVERGQSRFKASKRRVNRAQSPTKALESYRKRLGSDGSKNKGKTIFDDRLFNFALEYVREPELMDSVRNYLDNLYDDNGYRFSRAHYNYSDNSRSNDKSMLQQLELFKEPSTPSREWDPRIQRAVERVSAKYRNQLKPVSIKSVEDMKKAVEDWSTSAGYLYIEHPVYLKQGDGNVILNTKKSGYLNEELLTLFQHEVADAVFNGTFNKPYLLASRTQASGEYTLIGEETNKFKMKTRPVWIEHLVVLLAERMFAIPANHVLKMDHNTFLGKSDRWISDKLTNLRFNLHFNSFGTLDYSNYDCHVPDWLLHLAFQVLRSWFGFDVNLLLSSEESDLLDVLEHDYVVKTAILANGEMKVRKGEPSGSGLTSIIGNICHWIMCEFDAEYLGLDINYITMNDDNIVFFRGNKEEASSHLQRMLKLNSDVFGMIGNPDDIAVGDCLENPKVLSRVWTPKGPSREIHALMSKMFYPERYRKYDTGETNVNDVFYSYLLGYRQTMEAYFDCRAFLSDNRKRLRWLHNLDRGSPEFKNLPYNVQVNLT